ncbi:hypothetical protein AB0L88_07675 [Saccharopolyspora shandongensis]|uniref:Uncharacterized protein n=1 Tax=Saccharopolyspora shandongensis TaxID=418495 RepID=A0A1H3KIW4_9PSEU|nr:hypothetical protein [Saccharopolyspora shandongensis]SDY52066.1 hypothetical protein SAMN05216215_102861 [Saccharopolyspora shandongensis]
MVHTRPPLIARDTALADALARDGSALTFEQARARFQARID